MRVYIIHIPHTDSIRYAQAAELSFAKFSGWKPELFLGITKETLPDFEKQYPLNIKEKSRAMDFYNTDRNLYSIKKCCSMNHYRLFLKCVELDEPITIIEHDSHCIGDWKNIIFDDICVLNSESAIQQEVLQPIQHINQQPVKQGIADINYSGLHYRHDPKINGSHIMPGTAAYAVTPAGADKMIKVYENIGWEQSDFIINTAYVRIQTIVPELFTFRLPNLSMSHGGGL